MGEPHLLPLRPASRLVSLGRTLGAAGVRMPATGLCCARGRLTMVDSFLPQSGR